MAGPIKFSDIFDFTNDKDVQAAIKKIQSLDKTYDSFISKTKKLKSEYAKNLGDVVTMTEKLNSSVGKLNPTLEKDQQQIAAAAKSMDILSTTSGNLNGKIKDLNGNINKLEKEQKQFNKSAEQTVKLAREEEKLKAKLASLTTKEAAETQKLRVQIQEKNKQLKQSAKESLGLVSIYQKESQRLVDLRNKYKDVALQFGQNSKQARLLRTELTQLDARLKSVDAGAGQFQRNVGGYRQALGGLTGGFRQLAAALGFTGLIFAMVSAFRNAFNLFKDFQKENAVLAGVLDKTRKEITALTKDAQRLGGITAKTASEVTQLQIAYARLGFSQQEILNLTEDTINGSIALNANLAETAELTGAVVRTFDDLGTTDADVILDQMTRATQKSALQFEKLQTSIPIVAGAANAAGIPFTRLLSLLGKLSDAGIDASMSATALRNIFIESAAQGLNYEQILVKIGNSQDKLTAANDEFGKRAAVSGTILSNLTTEVGKLDKELQNAGGTAKRVSDEQLNALHGTIVLLNSAWQGFILNIENGEDKLSRLISSVLSNLTDILNKLSQSDEDIANAFITEHGIRTLEKYNALMEKAKGHLDETGERVAKIVKEQVIAREAQVIYNTAIDQGVKSLEDFVGVSDEFINITTDSKDAADILNAVMQQYIANAEKARKIKGGDKGGAVNQILFGGLTPSEYKEYILKYGDVTRKGMTDPIGEAVPIISKEMDKIEDENEATTSKLRKLWKVLGRDITEAFKAAFEAASIFVNQFFTNQSIKRENAFKKFEDNQQLEIDKLEERKNRELENENLTAEAKEAINQNYAQRIGAIEEQIDQKRRQLQIRQAKAEKAQAIFNAVINTAAAIAQTIGQTGFFGIPLAVIVGALGAAQVAAISSQPLPAFAKGTDDAPGGLAIVGEKGRELVMEPGGRTYLTGSGPELRDIPKGSQILTNAITERMLNQGAISREAENNERSAHNIRKSASMERAEVAKIMRMTVERENDHLIKGISNSISKNLVNNHFAFNHKGAITQAVKKGSTIRKDVELENKY